MVKGYVGQCETKGHNICRGALVNVYPVIHVRNLRLYSGQKLIYCNVGAEEYNIGCM